MPAEVGVSVRVPLIARSALFQAPAAAALSDAAQLVAPLDDQVIVVDVPATIDVAANLRPGAAGGVVAAVVTVRVAVVGFEVPMAFLQVSE